MAWAEELLPGGKDINVLPIINLPDDLSENSKRVLSCIQAEMILMGDGFTIDQIDGEFVSLEKSMSINFGIPIRDIRDGIIELIDKNVLQTRRGFSLHGCTCINDETDRVNRLKIMQYKNEGVDLPEDGWVYLLKAPDGLYKIGKTHRNPDIRIAEYSPKLPFETELEVCIRAEHYHELEHWLHIILSVFHVRGEWYKIPDNFIEAIKFAVKQYGVKS